MFSTLSAQSPSPEACKNPVQTLSLHPDHCEHQLKVLPVSPKCLQDCTAVCWEPRSQQRRKSNERSSKAPVCPCTSCAKLQRELAEVFHFNSTQNIQPLKRTGWQVQPLTLTWDSEFRIQEKLPTVVSKGKTDPHCVVNCVY